MSGKPNTSSSGMQPFDPAEEGSGAPESQSFRLEALGGLETSGSGGKKKVLPIHAIFLVLLVVAGGSVVVLMRVMGLGASFAFATPTKLDFQSSTATDTHIKLLEELQSSHVESQVPPELVQKNPFKLLADAPVDTGNPAPVDDGSALAQREAAAKKMKIMNTLAGMQIHTILGGSNPVARVNDVAIRVGDTFEEIFTVKSIAARHIVLECDGQEYTVSMDDEAEKQSTTNKKKR